MNKAEMREQLWGTVLAFDALRQRLITSCFIAEVQNFPQAKPGLQDFTEEMKKLVARCETLLKGMEGDREDMNARGPMLRAGCITISE